MSPSIAERRASMTSSCVDVKPLWKAAKKHDAARVKEIVLQFEATTGSLALVDLFHPRKGTTPLMVACSRSASTHNPSQSGADTVQMLLQFGADTALQAATKDGHTALHYAAISNQARAVEFMLFAGVNAFALNSNGHAAIDLARWHRSRDVLELLTHHARVHQGWLYVKKVPAPSASIQLSVWKKRYGVALYCDADRRMLELSLFKDPTDVKPNRVILLHTDTSEIDSLPKKKWLDKHNMFQVDHSLVVQKMNSKKRFSRVELSDQHHSSEMESETEELQFAADSTQQRDEWMLILGYSHATDAEAQMPVSFRNTLVGDLVVDNLRASLEFSPLSSSGSSNQSATEATERHVTFATSPSAHSPLSSASSTGSSTGEVPLPVLAETPMPAVMLLPSTEPPAAEGMASSSMEPPAAEEMASSSSTQPLAAEEMASPSSTQPLAAEEMPLSPTQPLVAEEISSSSTQTLSSSSMEPLVAEEMSSSSTQPLLATEAVVAEEMASSSPTQPPAAKDVLPSSAEPSTVENISSSTPTESAVAVPSAESSSSSPSPSPSRVDSTLLHDEPPATTPRHQCTICMDAKADAICIPCGHIAGCGSCLVRYVEEDKVCPICRGYVDTIIKVYDC